MSLKLQIFPPILCDQYTYYMFWTKLNLDFLKYLDIFLTIDQTNIPS